MRRKYPKEELEALLAQGYSRASAYRILRKRYENRESETNENKDEIENSQPEGDGMEMEDEIRVGSVDVEEANSEKVEEENTELEIEIDIDEEKERQEAEKSKTGEKISNDMQLVRMFVEGLHMLLLSFLEKFFNLILEDTSYLNDFNQRVVPLWKKILDKYNIFLLDWTEVMLMFSYGSLIMKLQRKDETSEKTQPQQKKPNNQSHPSQKNRDNRDQSLLTIEQINRMYEVK